ncbi:leucine-rich repeat-containing protein 40 isoform X6 [Drosophila hydei]|uniref:Leucine-rich repeat-containing protein 40 isoform X6 n=1 Tax=Drosophila hydei TaxID=7224 RepID=A0A6J1LBP3_DROHY|nr:leucine-rich repeat-containing protein 40 isoform X6 [Drosophila hydei]
MDSHMMINESLLNTTNFAEFDNSIDCCGDYNLDSVPASGCYNQYDDSPCEMNPRQNTSSTYAGVSRIPRGAARPRQGPSPRQGLSPRNYSFVPVFHERTSKEDDTLLTDNLWKLARKTGTLNLANKGMARVPERLYDINEADADSKKANLEKLSINEADAWWNQMPLNNLDLSSNSLTNLSPKIENLITLTVLQLHDNALVELPPQIGKLEKLVRLNLSHNKLKELPPDLYSLPELRHLNISHNEFVELSPDISNLHMLEFLDAGNNNISSLPGGIGFLVRLTALLLANNHIKELPSDIVYMRSLQKLDLIKNDLIGLPEDMGLLRKLQCLYIQHNDIKELPSFEGNEMLNELHASNNYIEQVPKQLCANLPHLKIFDLRDNKIKQLPDEICLMRNLNRLDVTNNSISVLPVTLSSLAHLISLQVDGNPIKTIRRDILQCGTARILKTLQDRAQTKDRVGGGAEDLPCSSSAAGSDQSMQQQLPANMTDNTTVRSRHSGTAIVDANVSTLCTRSSFVASTISNFQKNMNRGSSSSSNIISST